MNHLVGERGREEGREGGREGEIQCSERKHTVTCTCVYR